MLCTFRRPIKMSQPYKVQAYIAAIVLAALVSFQSAGWLLAWKGLQLEAVKKAQYAFDGNASNVQQRSFHQDHFKSIQIGRREIIFEGQLYDFRVMEKTGDSITVALYHDRHEQALLSALGHIFKANGTAQHPFDTPASLWLAQWLCTAFLVPDSPLIPSSNPVWAAKVLTAPSRIAPQTAPSVFAPPPEA